MLCIRRWKNGRVIDRRGGLAQRWPFCGLGIPYSANPVQCRANSSNLARSTLQEHARSYVQASFRFFA
jgi:hypothetical protein